MSSSANGVVRLAIALTLAVALVAACNSVPADGEGGDISAPFGVPPGCDPDGLLPCPDDWFVCTEDEAGNKRCEGQVAAAPDNGDWDCDMVDGSLICTGDHMPGDSGQWNCEEQGDTVTCTSEAYTPATDAEGEGIWDCEYVGEFMVCEAGEYEGEETPPDTPPGDVGMDFCFYDAEDPTAPPLVHGWYALELLEGRHVVHVVLRFNPGFVDNTYGVNSSSGYDHTFRDLVGSDKAEVGFLNGDGDEVLLARFDYISEADEAPTGYDCLGAADGDGRIIEGNEEDVVAATSSLDRNLNELECVFLEDSPTSEECPDWEFRVIYEMWIAADAFGDAGFLTASMTEVHASPSRTTNSIPVVPGPCP